MITQSREYHRNSFSQTNEILDDMLVMEGNLPTGHKTPSAPAFRRLRGVCSTLASPMPSPRLHRSSTPAATLETYAVIDKDIADLNGNTADFRLSEVRAFLEGMSQQVAATLIYGNQHTNPERFTGLAPRYSTKNTSNSATAANVLDGGGTSSTNTSIWIPVWGDDTSMVPSQRQDDWPPASRHGRMASSGRGRQHLSGLSRSFQGKSASSSAIGAMSPVSRTST